MSLAVGARIGPYEVTGTLGAGGMGEVYRAHDARLGRDVALKVLPDLFSNDPERLARFQREAQVLAALTHPNIGAIYGLEESPSTGPGQAGVRALVLELIEGDTLAEHLVRRAGPSGPASLPLDEALPIARQIAEALEAAHEQGVIHRDLKPSNIKVSADGAVKVLDFGLAKLTAAAVSGVSHGSPAALSMSPTITSPAATALGVILGTAAYMAPEQAKGRAADKRSDIWGFGCVLYEMLTGKRAFEGEDISDTLANVLKTDPNWQAVPSDLPPAIRILLRRCLEKDRRKRLSDVAAALVLIDESPGLSASTPDDHASIERENAALRQQVEAATTAARNTMRSLRRRARLAGAAAVVVSGLVAGTVVWMMTRAAPPPVVRTEVTSSGATALSPVGTDRDLAITPDGSRLVYRGSGQLFVRALNQLEPDALSGLGAPRGPFVSPDGQWIGFFDGNPLLKKVAITGGPPVTITRVDGTGPRGATWGPDGTIVYATSALATGLQRVSAAGGEFTVLTKPNVEKGEVDHLWPEFLPGRQAVLFTITAATGGLDNAQIAVLDLESGTYKVLVRGGSHAQYVSTGHLVYGAAGTLRAVAFDLDQLEVVGTPVPVLEQIGMTATGAVNLAVAANGTIVYALGSVTAAAVRSLVWVDRRGREDPIAAAPAPYVYPRLSPDGTRVALDIDGRNRDIWVWDLARETLSRLTSDPSIDRSPTWTRDGRRIIFSADRAGGVPNLFWQNADGTSEAERLIQSNASDFEAALTPDDKTVVFHELTSTARYDIMRSALEGDRRAEPLIHTNFDERNPQISPNGLWIAYESDASGRYEIYVRPFPDVRRGQWQISTAGGEEAVWSRDGGELFYRTPNGALMDVSIQRDSTWSAGKPMEVVKEGYYAGDIGRGLTNPTYDVARDGRFLVIKEQAAPSTTAPPSIIVVQNWFEELKRRAPTP